MLKNKFQLIKYKTTLAAVSQQWVVYSYCIWLILYFILNIVKESKNFRRFTNNIRLIVDYSLIRWYNSYIDNRDYEQEIYEIEFAQEKEQAELDYFEISDELSNVFQDAMESE